MVRVQLKRLPGPGGGHPSEDEVDDALQTFVVERWDRTVAALLGQASDDESMTRLLHTIVGRWRIDKVRETDRGSVRRRLHEHLTETAEFEQVPTGEPGARRWRLAGSAGAPWGGLVEDLINAARTVPAAAVRWTDPNRRPPIASAADLTAVLHAVMLAAHQQSVEEQQLVAVIVGRFPATLDPEFCAFDAKADLPSAGLSAEQLVQAALDAETLTAAAARIVSQLNPVERSVLPLIDNVSAVRQCLGVGRSSAYNYINKLKDLIRELAGGDDPEQIVLEVIDLCRSETAPATSEISTVAAVDNPAVVSSGLDVAIPSTAGGTS